MFPTNSERLIGISDAFSAFVYGYPSSCPRARCTPNKSAGMDLDIQAMPVGTYRVQSPGVPKIVYCLGLFKNRFMLHEKTISANVVAETLIRTYDHHLHPLHYLESTFYNII